MSIVKLLDLNTDTFDKPVWFSHCRKHVVFQKISQYEYIY